MQLYGLEFSPTIRLNVVDIEDYNIKSTFRHDAVCDTEYYGYRETTYHVESAEVKTNSGWWPLLDDEVRQLVQQNDSNVTLLVQNAIDDKQGEL